MGLPQRKNHQVIGWQLEQRIVVFAYEHMCVCVNLCASQGELAIMDFFRGIRQMSSQGIASI